MEWPRQPPMLGNNVVGLRPLEPTDIDDLLSAFADAQTSLFAAVPHTYTRSDAADFVDRAADATWPSFVLAITVDDDRFAGTCGLRIEDDATGVASVGYVVDPAVRGRGVATSAVRLLIAAAWSYGVQRVELETFATNVASRRVAAKCGLVQEDVQRGTTPTTDGPHDLVRYAIASPRSRMEQEFRVPDPSRGLESQHGARGTHAHDAKEP